MKHYVIWSHLNFKGQSAGNEQLEMHEKQNVAEPDSVLQKVSWQPFWKTVKSENKFAPSSEQLE